MELLPPPLLCSFLIYVLSPFRPSGSPKVAFPTQKRAATGSRVATKQLAPCRRRNSSRGHLSVVNVSRRAVGFCSPFSSVSFVRSPSALLPRFYRFFSALLQSPFGSLCRMQVIPQMSGEATDQTPPDLPSYLFKERIVYLVSLPPSIACSCTSVPCVS